MINQLGNMKSKDAYIETAISAAIDKVSDKDIKDTLKKVF